MVWYQLFRINHFENNLHQELYGKILIAMKVYVMELAQL